MDGWLDGCKNDGWMDEWTGGRKGEQSKSIIDLTDITDPLLAGEPS